MDLKYLAQNPELAMNSGAVITICLMIGDMLYCVNLGDCRAVLCRDSTALNLSVDHKASSTHEQNRIKKSGGYMYNNRVFGRLAVTRSIGDFDLKGYWDDQM